MGSCRNVSSRLTAIARIRPETIGYVRSQHAAVSSHADCRGYTVLKCSAKRLRRPQFTEGLLKGLSREAWRMIASIVRTYISALERGICSATIDIGC